MGPFHTRTQALAHEVKLGNGIPEMRHLFKSQEALKAVGFKFEPQWEVCLLTILVEIELC
jgi:hypothetical protein